MRCKILLFSSRPLQRNVTAVPRQSYRSRDLFHEQNRIVSWYCTLPFIYFCLKRDHIVFNIIVAVNGTGIVRFGIDGFSGNVVVLVRVLSVGSIITPLLTNNVVEGSTVANGK